MTFRKVWEEQMKMKTGPKYLLVQKVVKKQTNYLTAYQQAELLKGISGTAHGVHILGCLETNTGLNGWWTLQKNQRIKDKVLCSNAVRFFDKICEVIKPIPIAIVTKSLPAPGRLFKNK